MYKVFVNDKVIYFTNNAENCNQLSKGLTLSFYDKKITSYIVDLIFDDDKIDYVIITSKDFEEAFREFQEYFKIIEAAGGIVSNGNAEKLFIYRLEKWDLPKGKIEQGESIEEAAIREIEEECGIDQIKIKKSLESTYHLYKYKNELIFKKTYWFDMVSQFTGKLVPQVEEDITEVAWLAETQIQEKVMTDTYASIRELLR